MVLVLVWQFLQSVPRGESLGAALVNFLAEIAIFVVAITLHEYGHAFVATKLGDPTPRAMGRLTLDPRAHLDPIGTLLIFVAHFGYAKPVPINPAYFRKPGRDQVLVAMAGPAMNLLLCALCILGVRGLFPALQFATVIWWPWWKLLALQALVLSAILNATLAVFNLIPVPPLDGSYLLERALPPAQRMAYRQNQMLISAVGIVLLLSGVLSPLFRLVDMHVRSLCGL
ncbi:MAG: site-2 protease family protein [Candidatus Wallbacteria bacterium]|nr:site-2 protease family protein [Candidatus Wallbacteria bacterium]